MPLRIEYLVDHRDLVPVVAEWHWKDDGERTPLDFWVRAHSEESQGTKVPSCSVAFLHGRPVGCVSLIERNMDTHPELSPWLAALFVVPEVQGRGSEAPSHSTARIGLRSSATRCSTSMPRTLKASTLGSGGGTFAPSSSTKGQPSRECTSGWARRHSCTAPTSATRIVAVLGAPAARELLEALEQSDADRAALIRRLYARYDSRWLAELLIDLEADDVGEIARLRLVTELGDVLGGDDGRDLPIS